MDDKVNFPVLDFVKFPPVPLIGRLKVISEEFEISSVAPEDRDIAEVAEPRFPCVLICNVPTSTVVVPEYEFSAPNVKTPPPLFIKFPSPLIVLLKVQPALKMSVVPEDNDKFEVAVPPSLPLVPLPICSAPAETVMSCV